MSIDPQQLPADDREARLAAALDTSTDKGLLAQLMADPDPEVRAAAHANEGSRNLVPSRPVVILGAPSMRQPDVKSPSAGR